VTRTAADRLQAEAGTVPWRRPRLAALIRDRAAAGTAGLFSHGAHPLARTLNYPGDPGLFGPGSMTWPVAGDTAVFVGGVRALLIQAAHPEVAAGVAQHSRYRQDPLGRLTRTAAYVTATSFGAMPEVSRAVAMVRGRHRPVAGHSDRGLPYDASDPALSAWVHNTLTDSFLTAYRAYGAQPCPPADADRYVREQTKVGELLGAAPLPDTAAALSAWVASHPHLAPSPACAQAITFLRHPPLPPAILPAYHVLLRAAVATLPTRIQQITGLRSRPGDLTAGRAAVTTLRWALGSSPDWQLALARTGAAPPPQARFRQPPPTTTSPGKSLGRP
jgi:uncharacterized protein (DUF2236 family)